MAFYQSSCIKISDTKICPHCTAPTLIKNGVAGDVSMLQEAATS